MQTDITRGSMVGQRVGRLPAWLDILVILCGGAAFGLLSLDIPFNWDEDQYIAGVVLAATEVIYRDFMLLQTPLQPLLLAPVIQLFPGHVFIALRLINALLATLTLIGAYGAQRAAGVRGHIALLATVLLALCPPFFICATVVRNDMLPTALSALAMMAAVAATRSERRATLFWSLAGVGFGLAASAKISHVFFLAGAGSYLLWRCFSASERGPAWRSVLAYSAGCLAGLLPTLVLAAAAFDAFYFGVFRFALIGPFDWYQRNGLGNTLTLKGKLSTALLVLWKSPALPALLSVLVLRHVGPKPERRPEVLLLDTLIVMGGIGGMLPTPTSAYYLLTFLLPLFIRLGVALEAGIDGRRRVTLAAIGLTVLFALPSMVSYARSLHLRLRMPHEQWLASRIEAEAHWIGAQLQAAGARGPIATLSPFIVVDSGYPLDPRFATGVFVYRSGALLSAQDHQRYHTVGPATLAQSLDAEPPAAIIVGYQSTPRPFPIVLDPELRDYAESRGYRLLHSPLGAAELYVNPAAQPVNSPAPPP